MRAMLWAAIASLVAGCGNDTVHHLKDGGADAAADAPPDTAIDAPPDAPPVGLVTVHYTFFDAPPDIGRAVYFLDADSNVVAEATTDVTGTASATMAAGGSVTIVEPAEDLRAARRAHPHASPAIGGEVFTVLDVAPGDDYVIAGFPNANVGAATFDLTVPAFAGAATTVAQTSCGAAQITGGSASSITLDACNGSADFLIVAYDGSNVPLASIYAPNVAVVDGQAVQLAGPYEAALAQTLSVSGLPNLFTSVTLTESLDGPAGDGAVGFLPFTGTAASSITGLTASGTITVPTSADPTLVQLVTTDIAQEALDNQRVVQWGAPNASYAVDVSSLLLADFATAPTTQASDQTIRWTANPGGADPDATVAIVQLASGGRWYVVAPGGGTGVVQLPHMPSDQFVIAVGDGDGFEQFETMTITGGYRAARLAHPWSDIDVAAPALAASGSGTAAFAILQPQ